MGKQKISTKVRWVNEEFRKRVSGTHMKNKDKTKLFQRLWKEAHLRFK